jgi:hypothetical protein
MERNRSRIPSEPTFTAHRSAALHCANTERETNNTVMAAIRATEEERHRQPC